jgi:hypothetical protein
LSKQFSEKANTSSPTPATPSMKLQHGFATGWIFESPCGISSWHIEQHPLPFLQTVGARAAIHPTPCPSCLQVISRTLSEKPAKGVAYLQFGKNGSRENWM